MKRNWQIKPAESIAYLQSKLIGKEANAYLHDLSHRFRLPYLFQHFFADDFKRHENCNFDKTADRRKMLRDFYKLVHENLFCIDCMVLWDEEDDLDWYIPIHVHNSDWWECEFDELNSFEQAILEGAGKASEGKLMNIDSMSIEVEVDWKVLEGLCGKQKPLCYLSDAVSIVSHRTGCPWIDLDHESVHGGYVSPPEWTIDEVALHAEQYAECERLWSGVGELNKWIEADKPKKGKPSRYDRVVEIVRQSHPQAKTLARILVRV
jgi:hypothetical protein